jgi:hypothetical protein
MIDRSHDLSITKQAKVLNVNRGSIYYLPWAAADRGSRIRSGKPHLLPLFTVGYVPERLFFATATYTTPPDRISGNLPSAKYCNLCCSHNPIASESKLSRRKENGPNPSVTPSNFSSPTLKSKASNCLIE